MKDVKLSELRKAICDAWQVPPGSVKTIAVALQHAGYLPVGKGGRSGAAAPLVGLYGAATLILAVAASIKAGKRVADAVEMVDQFGALPFFRIDRAQTALNQAAFRTLDPAFEEDRPELDLVDVNADLLAVMTKQIMVYTGHEASAVGVGALINFIRLQTRGEWRCATVDIGDLSEAGELTTTHFASYAFDLGLYQPHEYFGALPLAVSNSTEFGGGIFNVVAQLYREPIPWSEKLGVA